MRELYEMAVGRMRHEWDMTCQIVAMTHNVQAIKKSQRIKAEKINPMRVRPAKATPGSMDQLADLIGAE